MNQQFEQYALITAARNEDGFIEATLQSVVAQTVKPVRWLVISDGSTDRTDEIIQRYAAQHPWIEYIRLDNQKERAFSNQAFAVNEGFARLRDTEIPLIGLLDADITFGPDYYAGLLAHFAANPKLGIGGGTIWENRTGEFRPRYSNYESNVAGAVQMFRRQCFLDVGGYALLRYGGYDTVAIQSARMRGWEVRSFDDLRVDHHRPPVFRAKSRLRDGYRDYLLGYPLLFVLCKSVYRGFREKPYLLSGVCWLAGYCHAALRREKIILPPDYLTYFRQEQLKRIGLSSGGRKIEANNAAVQARPR